MKKLTLIISLVLVFSQRNHAQIAIYDYKGTTTVLGGGANQPSSAVGNLAIDLTTMEAVYIGLLTFGTGRNTQIFFQETPLANFISTQVVGPRSSSYTVLAKAESPGTQYADVVLQSSQAIGINSNNVIRTSPSRLNWVLPKSLKSNGLVITEDASFDYLGQESGTYTFNSKLTVAYNNTGSSVSDYVSFVRNFYASRGIQEIVLPPAQ
jgi:hypothetical protein